MKSENLLEVTDLSIGFKSSLQENLSFTLNNGDILFVKGRNGAGKSTLIKTLCGELKPLSGDIDWKIKREEISVLPQIVSHEFPLSVTLGEIIDVFGPKNSIRSFLPKKLHDRRFNDASGGERQKTLILSRLKKDVSFLILDEPFNHLDQEACKEMMSFISELIVSKTLRGIILISHIDVNFTNEKIKELTLS